MVGNEVMRGPGEADNYFTALLGAFTGEKEIFELCSKCSGTYHKIVSAADWLNPKNGAKHVSVYGNNGTSYTFFEEMSRQITERATTYADVLMGSFNKYKLKKQYSTWYGRDNTSEVARKSLDLLLQKAELMYQKFEKVKAVYEAMNPKEVIAPMKVGGIEEIVIDGTEPAAA